jgi:hypothetical protein
MVLVELGPVVSIVPLSVPLSVFIVLFELGPVLLIVVAVTGAGAPTTVDPAGGVVTDCVTGTYTPDGASKTHTM